MRAYLAALLLTLTAVAVAPTVAADHVSCYVPPGTPHAVALACGVVAGAANLAIHSAEAVVDYLLCYINTAPSQWASQCL